MKKIETIWHHLLYSALTKKKYKFTQKELAKLFNFSLSTVHHALESPTKMGAIRKTARFFVLEDFSKLLYYWASMRELSKDIVYKTYFNAPIVEIEGLVPPGSIYAGYSAARRILNEPPADYSKVYFYFQIEKLNQAKNGFPESNDIHPNIFVLKMPAALPKYGEITTLPQTFVDIWNMSDWYSKDFTQALQEKINELLS